MIFILTAINRYTEHFNRFIGSLNSQIYPHVHLIVVLDGCNINKKLSCKYPYTYLKGNGGLYWGGSMAKGISNILKLAKDLDYILTINVDCEIPPSFIKSLLVEISIHQNKCLLGTACVDVNGKLIDAGWTVDWQRGSINRTKYTNLKEVLNSSTQVNYSFLSSKGTLIPISIIKKIGNYNHRHFPHYASDFEYSNRAKRMGFKLIISRKTWVINDPTNTGISGVLSSNITLKQLFILLFSIKSQINIKDHFFLILDCCPWHLQPLNYLYLMGKIIYLISFLKPFYRFRPVLVKIRSHLLSLPE